MAVNRARRGRLFQVAALFLTILPPLFMIFWIRGHLVSIPYWDEWDQTPLIVNYHNGTLTFAQLWSPHNEHRVLTTNLLTIALDAMLHQWNPVSEIFVSITLAIATLAGLAMLGFRSLPERRALVLACLLSPIVFSTAQYENWTWGFQVGWFTVDAALVWSIVLLTSKTNRRWCFLAAAACGAVATATLASGLLVWIACGLVIIVTARSDRLERIFAWTALSLAAGTTYFWGLPHAGSGSIFSGAAERVAYALAYLVYPVAAPLGYPGISIVGWLFAIALVALVALLVLDVDRERVSRALPWLGLIAFAVLCAGSTALGRASLGIGTAGSPRYTTVSQLAWIALIAIATVYAPLVWHRARIAGVATSAIVGVLFLLDQWQTYPSMAIAAQRLDYVRSALVAGTATDEILQSIYPSATREREYISELRALGEGPFTARGRY